MHIPTTDREVLDLLKNVPVYDKFLRNDYQEKELVRWYEEDNVCVFGYTVWSSGGYLKGSEEFRIIESKDSWKVIVGDRYISKGREDAYS